jgi:hypothetical protein
MNREDIIRLAREAGLIHYHDSEGHWTGVTNDDLIEVEENRWDDKLVRILEPFATLVAAAEREECAKICEEGTFLEGVGAKTDDPMDKRIGKAIANAIRARSNYELPRQLQPDTEATEELPDVRGGEVPGQA